MAIAAVTRRKNSRRTRAGGHGRVAAQHGDTRAVLGSAEGHHVLADMRGDYLAMMAAAVGKDVLDQIIAKLITSNCAHVSL